MHWNGRTSYISQQCFGCEQQVQPSSSHRPTNQGTKHVAGQSSFVQAELHVCLRFTPENIKRLVKHIPGYVIVCYGKWSIEMDDRTKHDDLPLKNGETWLNCQRVIVIFLMAMSPGRNGFRKHSRYHIFTSSLKQASATCAG